MKTLFVLALLGACVAVAYASYGCYGDYKYECVKDDYKKCKAVEVCEGHKEEKCGHDYCKYGYVCASKKKEVCKDFIKLKEKCEEKKVCKEVKKKCGYDYCSYHEECVKDKVCIIKHENGYGRRLLGGSTSSHAHASAGDKHDHGHHDHKDHHGGHGKKFGGYYYEHCGYCKKKEKLECYDAYSCEKKEPCKEVIVKKCVKDHYRPGYDVCHGGHDFKWYKGYSYGEKCGDEYCGHGYKCADVYYQKCEAEKCGDHYCQYGYECVAEDDDCKKYAYLETVCKDVYEPTCIALGYYAKSYYYPKCKTVYKCDKEENICGGKYCGYGYSCGLKKCGGYGYHEKDDHKHYYLYKDHDKHHYDDKHYDDKHYDDKHYDNKHYDNKHHKKGGKSSAYSHSTSVASGGNTYTDTYTAARGDHAHAGAGAHSKTKYATSGSNSGAHAYDGHAATGTDSHTYAHPHYYAGANAGSYANSHYGYP